MLPRDTTLWNALARYDLMKRSREIRLSCLEQSKCISSLLNWVTDLSHCSHLYVCSPVWVLCSFVRSPELKGLLKVINVSPIIIVDFIKINLSIKFACFSVNFLFVNSGSFTALISFKYFSSHVSSLTIHKITWSRKFSVFLWS